MQKAQLSAKHTLYEDGTVWNETKQLAPYKNRTGYMRVKIQGKNTFIHIKVVEHFGDCNGTRIPEGATTLRELGLSIDHKDRNKRNNSRENLELVTHKENCRRKYE